MKKRLFDIALSSALLAALSPVMAVLYAVTRAKMGSPVFFSQTRIGQDAQPFTIYKFRSMTDDRDAKGQLLPNEDRITPFGKFIRRIGLDELPQLVNILKGDMSFVGPRPISLGLYQRLNPVPPEAPVILSVKPGLTGPAQVERIYRGNGLSMDERLIEDWIYASARPSLRRDAKMIFRTAAIFVFGNGDSKDQTNKVDLGNNAISQPALRR